MIVGLVEDPADATHDLRSVSPRPSRLPAARESRELQANLRFILGEGAAHSVMVGMGESYLPAFVLAMGAALLVWLAVLSGRTGATDPYFILYRNVMGLSVGTQVLYEGYPLGLIEEISRDTLQQSGSASKVAESMQEILAVTEQTTKGTQQTAVSIGQLADLAVELKGSVSGFKV